MKRALALLVGVALAWEPSSAETLGETIGRARAAGQVGERFDGYLGVASESGASLRQSVQAINIRRRSIYSQFATSCGVSLQEVSITAGCQLLGTVGLGERYALSDNVWRVRAPGQAEPIPDYCR